MSYKTKHALVRHTRAGRNINVNLVLNTSVEIGSALFILR